MPISILTKYIYGQVVLTGMYSFQFVDKNINTIQEIFLMCPPKTTELSEGTRSATVPTLSGNYNLDAGNATKHATISGELFFTDVGFPNNPTQSVTDPSTAETEGDFGAITGYEEILKLRWMLIRYRDYTMSRKAKVTIPPDLLNPNKGVSQLYQKIAKQVKNKKGALLDEIKLIYHDYDMDDHFFCRIENLTVNRSADRHQAAQYNISMELYEPFFSASSALSTGIQRADVNQSVDLDVATLISSTNTTTAPTSAQILEALA